MSDGSDLANTLATALLAGTDFSVTLPDFSDDIFQIPDIGNTGVDAPIPQLSIADLTSGTITGNGVFDKMMVAYKAHLKEEYSAGRITGAEYTKAYIALTESAMNGSIQFLLGKSQAYWAAVNAQLMAQTAKIQLVTARVELEKSKVQLVTLRIEALNASITYALNKLRLAIENVEYDTKKYNLTNIMPQELLLAQKSVEKTTADIAQMTKQNSLTDKQILIAQGEVDNIPAKADMLAKQITGQINDNSYKLKQIDLVQKEINLGDQKLALLIKQVAYQQAQTDLVNKQIAQAQADLDLQDTKEDLLKEQVEAARAQTLDTRTDSTPITGMLGKQKDLYTQQITSYKRDAEMKGVKVFVDAWVTMKTIDEGLAPPTMFANTNLDAILTTMKTNLGL